MVELKSMNSINVCCDLIFILFYLESIFMIFAVLLFYVEKVDSQFASILARILCLST